MAPPPAHQLTRSPAHPPTRSPAHTLNGQVIWIMGLPGSGKTTLATQLAAMIPDAYHLDGDTLRQSPINQDAGYSTFQRLRAHKRAAWIAAEVARLGHVVVASFVTPTRRIQARVRELVGEERFHLVYLRTPRRLCEQRRGKLWDMDWEPPTKTRALRIGGGGIVLPPEVLAQQILAYVSPLAPPETS